MSSDEVCRSRGTAGSPNIVVPNQQEGLRFVFELMQKGSASVTVGSALWNRHTGEHRCNDVLPPK
jgi:hypothetical protein